MNTYDTNFFIKIVIPSRTKLKKIIKELTGNNCIILRSIITELESHFDTIQPQLLKFNHESTKTSVKQVINSPFFSKFSKRYQEIGNYINKNHTNKEVFEELIKNIHTLHIYLKNSKRFFPTTKEELDMLKKTEEYKKLEALNNTNDKEHLTLTELYGRQTKQTINFISMDKDLISDSNTKNIRENYPHIKPIHGTKF